MTEGSHGIDRLRSKTTLREILEVATEFEASARDFYRGLIPKVSKRTRPTACPTKSPPPTRRAACRL